MTETEVNELSQAIRKLADAIDRMGKPIISIDRQPLNFGDKSWQRNSCGACHKPLLGDAGTGLAGGDFCRCVRA